MLIFPAQALAIAPPDVGPTIIVAAMYQNVLQPGDEYLIAKYSMDYTVNPTDPIDVTFLARLISGTDELGNASPYPYKDLGYNLGIFSIYWANTSAYLPIWGNTTYNLRLEGNPSMNWTGTTPLATLSSASFIWVTSSSVAATAAILGPDIIALAEELGSYWNISLDSPVSNGGVNGNVLTTSGEIYFTNAISGLRSIVPELFSTSSTAINYEDDVNPQTHATALTARRGSLGLYEGSVGGVSTDVIYAFISIVVTVLVAAGVASILSGQGGQMAQIGGLLAGIVMALAVTPLLFVFIGTLSAIVYGALAFLAVIILGRWIGTQIGVVL